MIIKLPQADFSADNIGTVTVPRTLSAFTLAAIEAGGRSDLTDLQKAALDDFFIAIGAGEAGATIASKMNYIFIPSIAGELAKSLINYKNTDFTVEKTPDSSVWSVNYKGLVAADNGSSKAITIALSTPLMANNACLLFFRGDMFGTTNPGNQHYLSIRGATDTSKWLSMYQYQNTENAGHFTTGGLPSQWISGGYNETYPTVNGYNLTSGGAKKVIGGVVASVTAPSVDMSTEASQTVYAFGMSSKNTIPTAFAMLGQGLTDTELTDLLPVIGRLRDALLGVNQ